MPNRPIDFKFTSDVVNLLNGLGKAELSVEDLEQAFVNASNSSQDLERKISRATREAERDVEKLERAVRDLPEATDDAARAADHDFERISDSAREAGAETADEFKQNLGSGLAAGGSPVEILTESLGGLVASLKGPVGLAAAGVAGVSLLAFTKIQENAEKAKASIEALAGVVEGLYTQGVVTATKTEQLAAATKWIEDNYELLKGYKDEADLAGIKLEEFATAAASGGQPLADLRTKLEEVARTAETPAQRLAASDLIGYLDSVDTKLADVGTKEGLIAASAGLLAENYGLADRNLDNVVNDADLLYVTLDKAVDEAAAVGTGNTALDALLAKADKLGWSALTAKEKADLIGSDNTALAELQTAAAAVEEDTRQTKANIDNLADPGLPTTKKDIQEIDTKLRNLPKDIQVRVAYTAPKDTISGTYTQGYTVGSQSSSKYGYP